MGLNLIGYGDDSDSSSSSSSSGQGAKKPTEDSKAAEKAPKEDKKQDA